MHAEVIAIGDELTSGQRLDTNSRWMAAELGVLGVPVTFHTTVPDTLEAGIEAFRLAAARAPIVVVTGGLGPTADDLTRDVLAAAAGVPLDLSAEALATVESRFTRRGMPMPESNRRQAMFPRGSRIIPNAEGTAPGIDVDLPRPHGCSCRVFALPGVPAEMKPMWKATVEPAVLAMLPDRATIVQRRIKCFGAGESAIEAMLPDLIRRGRDPLVGITAHEATITLRIAARGRDEAECLEKMAPTEVTIRECLGALAYGIEDDEIEDAVLAAVAGRGGTLASAESGTAGRVAALLAQADARRGATAGVFRGGTVIPACGDARAAAADARTRCGATIGLAVGDVRPTAEGRRAIDVAIADADGITVAEHVFGGGPDLAPMRAAKSAINLVRLRMLEGATR
jgi:nicotinamide-nucleotide amidase